MVDAAGLANHVPADTVNVEPDTLVPVTAGAETTTGTPVTTAVDGTTFVTDPNEFARVTENVMKCPMSAGANK